MILICFHRLAAQTILFGILVPLDCETFSLILWTYQKGIKGGSLLFCMHPTCAHWKNIWAQHWDIISLPCHIFQGHLSGATHSFVIAAEKTTTWGDIRVSESQCWYSGGTSELKTVLDTHGVESKCRIKCERHTKTTLKTMRRRRAVTPQGHPDHNDT